MKNAINLINLSGVAKSNYSPAPHTHCTISPRLQTLRVASVLGLETRWCEGLSCVVVLVIT
jgi:hypothetical protein